MKVLVLTAILLGASCLEAAGPFSINGFHLLGWTPQDYQRADARQSLKEIADLGAGWVVIMPRHLMDNGSSNSIDWSNDSKDNGALESIIADAKALGLKVAIKPHVDTRDGTFRGLIDPKDPKAWFASYSSMTLHYARLAQDSGADALAVGTELMSMTKPHLTHYWKDLIRNTRAKFQGHVTYAAFMVEFPQIRFWSELDSIGVDAYFPMGVPGSEAKRQDMAALWRDFYIPLLKGFSSGQGKPILFAEIGIASQEGAHVRPWAYEPGKVDLQVQSEYFSAFFDAFQNEHSWCSGFWHYGWTVYGNDGGPNSYDHTIEGKPVLDIFRAAFNPPPPPKAKS